MKKTYQNPSTKVVRIEMHRMIATSQTVGFGGPVGTAEGADSRRGHDYWDDDDEE